MGFLFVCRCLIRVCKHISVFCRCLIRVCTHITYKRAGSTFRYSLPRGTTFLRQWNPLFVAGGGGGAGQCCAGQDALMAEYGGDGSGSESICKGGRFDLPQHTSTPLPILELVRCYVLHLMRIRCVSSSKYCTPEMDWPVSRSLGIKFSVPTVALDSMGMLLGTKVDVCQMKQNSTTHRCVHTLHAVSMCTRACPPSPSAVCFPPAPAAAGE